MKTNLKAKSVNPITGDFVLDIDVQFQPLLSPDKTKKLLPCDSCKTMVWKNLNVVSFLCNDCGNKH